MKKTHFLIIILCLSFGFLSAQNINYDNIVTQEGAKPKDFEAYLVQLAWMNTPANRAVEIEKKVAEIEEKAGKWKWTEDINGSMNFNPASDIVTIGGAEFLRPGVTYGLSMSVGGLITNKYERQALSEKTKIADLEISQQKLQIRALVSKAYQRYLLANEVLKSRYEAEEDLSAAYTITAELFKKNRAEVSEYTAASSAYFIAVEQRQISEAEIEMAIIDIEELIGIEWDTAQRFEKVYGK